MRSGLRLADHDRVGLDLDREHQPARVLEDLEQIRPEENLAAADGEEEDPGVGELVEQILDLGGRHLAVIVVIEVAVHAPLVAAVGEVELRAERDAKAQRPGTHFPHQRAHVARPKLNDVAVSANRFIPDPTVSA